MSTKTNAPMVLFFCTNRLAESTELKKNTLKRNTANAMMLSNNGEKSKIDIIILYKTERREEHEKADLWKADGSGHSAPDTGTYSVLGGGLAVL